MRRWAVMLGALAAGAVLFPGPARASVIWDGDARAGPGNRTAPAARAPSITAHRRMTPPSVQWHTSMDASGRRAGSLVRRLRCHRVGQGTTEPAVALGEQLTGVPEVPPVEVGPQRVQRDELGVGGLPDQE